MNKISIFDSMKKYLLFPLLLLFFEFSHAQLPEFSEEAFKKYFIENLENLDPIEGIWSLSTTQETYHFDTLFEVQQSKEPVKIALMKKKDKFYSYNMSGELFEAEFNPTDVKGVYLYRNYYPLISKYTRNQAVISKAGQMEYTYDFPEEFLQEKMGSKYKEGIRMVNILKWNKYFPSK